MSWSYVTVCPYPPEPCAGVRIAPRAPWDSAADQHVCAGQRFPLLTKARLKEDRGGQTAAILLQSSENARTMATPAAGADSRTATAEVLSATLRW